MKKIIFTIAFIATGLVASAQVGVGTTNPETSLEVVGKNADATTKAPAGLDAADGITVPVVTTDMTIALPGIAAGTRVSQMVYSTFAGKAGYYFWDGAKWSKIGAVAPVSKTIRVATVATITSADYNNVIVAGVPAMQFSLAGLTPSEGDTLTIMDGAGDGTTSFNNTTGAGVTGTTTLALPGGAITIMYDAETDEWYSINAY